MSQLQRRLCFRVIELPALQAAALGGGFNYQRVNAGWERRYETLFLRSRQPVETRCRWQEEDPGCKLIKTTCLRCPEPAAAHCLSGNPAVK